LQVVRRQLEDYGTDLDGLKGKFIEGERVPLLPRLDVRSMTGGLVNKGSPSPRDAADVRGRSSYRRGGRISHNTEFANRSGRGMCACTTP
jgi:hypothetical protein